MQSDIALLIEVGVGLFFIAVWVYAGLQGE